MTNSVKRMFGAALAAAALVWLPAAQAGTTTFDIKWANDSGVNIASAVLTLDPTLIHSPPSGVGYIAIDQIQSLTVTVAGANVGNGVFNKASFTGITFFTASPLDLSKELLGQEVTLHKEVGGVDTTYTALFGLDEDAWTGAFNLFSSALTTPHTVRPFAIITDGTAEVSDYLHVSSILARDVSAVPEPETYALMLAGLALVGLRSRRRKAS